MLPLAEEEKKDLIQKYLEQQFNPSNMQADQELQDERQLYSNLGRGVSTITAGLTGTQPQEKFYDSLDTQIANDSKGRRSKISDYLKNKASENWKQLNYDQRERAIDVQKTNREEDIDRKEKETTYQHEKDAAAADKPKDKQYDAALFGRRIEQSEKDFEDLAKKGYNRAGYIESVQANVPNEIASENTKRQDQAERNFVNAVLRRESGAAISAAEFSNAEQQYFPRAGDQQSVLDQKKRNREQAMVGLKVAAGPAWEKVPLVGGKKLSKVDQDAKDWAIANPKDPRAAKILNRLGE